MRLQAAVEFLATYSFMFLVLGVAFALIILGSITQNQIVSSTCTAVAGLGCNFVYLYSAPTIGYSVLSFVITNPQSVAVNITNFTATINSANYTGACSSNFLVPGQQSDCKVYLPSKTTDYTLIKGSYIANAMFCASSLSNITPTNCVGNNVLYSGSFFVQALPTNYVTLGVSAGVLPMSLQQISSAPSNPESLLVSNSFLTRQSAYWVGSVSGYSFASSSYLPSNHVGYGTILFPNSTSVLNNNNVACASPYNSTASLAYTVFYSTGSGSRTINKYASANAVETTYYKAANSIAWSSGTSFTAASNTYYDIAILWYNKCGPGAQGFNVTNTLV